MRDRKVELLAPAGSWEAFVAAVENGADAVYLGGKLFNARQYAGNFDSEQLKMVLDYAHLRDVKIYLTMNTLVNDSEIRDALDQVEEAYAMGIDGIIVQDIGFASLVREVFPDLDLHASTQMTVYNVEGVKVLESLGFKRAVLARELSLDEIQKIAKSTSLEIEVFIHGALCISYSGQCLMSSVIGARSGNRGKCAQPCRLKYELVNRNKDRKSQTAEGLEHQKGAAYIMSPKDIGSINELAELIQSGIASLKIEGRMKTPEYVATVVRVYRKYLDRIPDEESGCVDETDMKNLMQIFNRGGLSRGYLKGKTGRDMMSYEKPKNWGLPLGEVLSYDRTAKTVKVKLSEEIAIGDGVEVWNGEDESPGTIVTEIKSNGRNVTEAKRGEIVSLGSVKGKVYQGNKIYKTSDKKLNREARESYEGNRSRKTQIAGRITIKREVPVALQIKDSMGNTVDVEGEIIPEVAVNRPLTKERLIDQMYKTGATPFKFSELQVELEDGLSLPIGEINNLRRRALEQLESKRIQSIKRNMSEEMRNKKDKLLYFLGNSRKPLENTKISLFMYSFRENIDLTELSADRIYLPVSSLFEEASRQALKAAISQKNSELFLWVPSITRGNYDRRIKSWLQEAMAMGIDGLLVGNIGGLDLVKEFPQLTIVGEYSLNVYNSFSIEQLTQAGFQGTTLSLELTMAQIAALKNTPGFQKEAIVYGRIPLMTSEYCPVGSIVGGHNSKVKCNNVCVKGAYALKDRMGMEFPVLCDRIDCRSTVLNANVIFLGDSLSKLKSTGVDIMRINLFDESLQEITQLIQFHRDVIKNGPSVLGKYHSLIDAIKSKGHTKGHYFRGV